MSNKDDDISDDFETDDFDLDGFDDDGGFDDLNDQKGTLGDLWRNNPLVKVGVIFAAVLFLVGGIIMFGGEPEPETPSRVSTVADVSEAPGSADVSEAIRQATEEETRRRAEEAIRTQTSALPTPLEQPKGTLGIQIEQPEEEDPLERWRRMQEERIRQQQQAQTQAAATIQEVPQEEVDTRTPAVNALSAAMAQQMGSILGSQSVDGAQTRNVSSADYLERQREEALAELEAQRQEALAAGGAEGVAGQVEDLNIILPAGTIEYAQLLTEANTDAPGPILAQIVTGPLKGGRMIGSFTAQQNYLTLTFDTIVIDGIDFAANGIAIDPDTTLPGVVTDIDRRYFKRIILPAAAEFVTGLTRAIAESGTTTITIDGDSTTSTTSNANTSNDQEVATGIEQAGEEISDIMDEIADDVEPLLRVRAGTPLGILFTSPVVGTPQIVQQREEEERERERLFSIPAGGNFIGGQR